MNSRNIPYRITYILALFLMFLAAVFYRQSLLTVLLLLLLILPVLSLAATRFASRRLRISVESPHDELTLPTTLRVRVILYNPTPFPLLNCCLRFTARNLYFPPLPTQELLVPAEAGRRMEYLLPFRLDAAGMFSFSMDEVCVNDFLHLYSFRLKRDFRFELPILPAPVTLPPLNLTKAMIESEESVASADGELTSDIKQLRDYRPGDRIRDIHWKMTARVGDVMVKEYERAKDLYYLLLPETDKRSLQDCIAYFYSLGQWLLKQKESYRVALYHIDDRSFEFLPVNSEDELLICLYRLYLEPVEERSAAYESLLNQRPDIGGVIRIHGAHILS